jgi:hypothetical protein
MILRYLVNNMNNNGENPIIENKGSEGSEVVYEKR